MSTVTVVILDIHYGRSYI